MKSPLVLAKRAASAGRPLCFSCRRSLLRQLSSSAAARVPGGAPAAAFQSYPLNPHPASAPRNARAPDTSITRPAEAPPLPRVHDTRPPQKDAHAGVAAAVSEHEAQTSRPAFAGSAAAATATSTSSPSPPQPAEAAAATASATSTAASTPAARPGARPARASKLRAPRKAAMKLTPSAVAHLRGLLEGPEPKLIKVGVRNRGCSGLAYHLEYVDRAGAFDETVEQDGVRVLIDSKALFSIIGTEMDWVEDKLNQRFVFRNPNIKEQCGCGESFMV